jgi:hypothetical protein
MRRFKAFASVVRAEPAGMNGSAGFTAGIDAAD